MVVYDSHFPPWPAPPRRLPAAPRRPESWAPGTTWTTSTTWNLIINLIFLDVCTTKRKIFTYWPESWAPGTTWSTTWATWNLIINLIFLQQKERFLLIEHIIPTPKTPSAKRKDIDSTSCALLFCKNIIPPFILWRSRFIAFIFYSSEICSQSQL